jgi:tRNA(fMet)-specific endonuclease VapC
VAARRILVDSSLIIDYYRKEKKESCQLYQLFQVGTRLYISAITVYELLCGAKSPQLQEDTEDIIGLFDILEFGQNEAKTASNLYKQLKQKNQLIETADILIAATALGYSLEIATLNIGHFSRFEGVKIAKI